MLLTRGQQEHDARLQHLKKGRRAVKEKKKGHCTSSTVTRIKKRARRKNSFIWSSSSSSLSLFLSATLLYNYTCIIPHIRFIVSKDIDRHNNEANTISHPARNTNMYVYYMKNKRISL